MGEGPAAWQNARRSPPGMRSALTHALSCDAFQPIVSGFASADGARFLFGVFPSVLKIICVEAVKCPPVRVLKSHCLGRRAHD